MHCGQNKVSAAACITVLVLRASHQLDVCWAGFTSQQVLLNKYPLRELIHGTSKGMPRPLKNMQTKLQVAIVKYTTLVLRSIQIIIASSATVTPASHGHRATSIATSTT